jgi:hypothetical protein
MTNDLPQNFITMSARSTDAQLAPSDCGTFEVDVGRIPSVFARAYLVYSSKGAFRPFVLRRSINGLAETGGAWVDGDGTTRTSAEEIDPSVLHLGSNEVSLCVPDDATRGVAISNVHLVGEIDAGTDLVDAMTVGAEARDGSAALDADPATTVDVPANEPIRLTFARLISPDAIVLSETRTFDPATLASIECVETGDKVSALKWQPRTAGGQPVVQLDAGTARCGALAVTFSAPQTIGSVEVIGSGAAEPVDWARVVVTSPAEHFGATAWVGGFVARPAAITGAVRVDVAGHASEVMTGDFGTLLRRSSDTQASWPVAVVATLPDGSKHTSQLLLARDASKQLGAATSGAAAPTSLSPDALYGKPGTVAVGHATRLDAAQIRLGTRVGVDLPAGAVDVPTNSPCASSMMAPCHRSTPA